MKEKMFVKRIAAGIAAIMTAATLCACDDLDEYDDYSEEDTSEQTVASRSEEVTEALSDRSSESFNGRGSKLNLDSNGGVSITRLARDNSASMGDADTWTVFVYMCGSDLESENGLAVDDIEEMANAYTGDNVRFVVQTGGSTRWNGYDISADSLQRFEVTGGGVYLVDEVSDADMGQEQTLEDFLRWGVQNYPADKMGVVFWNHGGGSITGVCFDEKNEYDSLSLTDLDKAFTSVFDEMTDKFEFVGFDACLMATVETANVLVPHARYMIASEETEPGRGWDYTEIGRYLDENLGCTGAQVGKVAADSFYDSCAASDEEAGATLSVTDLSKIDKLIVAINNAAASMNGASDDSSNLSGMVRSIRNAKNYGGNNKSEGYTNMVDLGELFKSACGDSEAQAVMDALNDAVVYNVYGDDEYGSNGLSTYYPLSIEGSQELNIFKEICVSPQYMSFVDKMAYGSANGSIDGYSDDMWLDEENGYWDDESWEETDFWSYLDDLIGGGLSFTDNDSSINFAEGPYLNDEGTFTFTLDSGSIDNVSGVYCSVFYVDEENGYLYELGLDNYVNVDWDNGTVEDKFDGLWYMLGDGQVLAAYIVEEGEDYDIYTAPILLNGEQTNLRIKMQYHDDGYDNFILGTWDGIDENGQADKTVRKLRQGDVITPVYYTYDENGEYVDDMTGDEYVYDGDTKVYDNFLPSADYLYSFCIEDIFGNSSYTDFVTFNVDDSGAVSFYID